MIVSLSLVLGARNLPATTKGTHDRSAGSIRASVLAVAVVGRPGILMCSEEHVAALGNTAGNVVRQGHIDVRSLSVVRRARQNVGAQVT